MGTVGRVPCVNWGKTETETGLCVIQEKVCFHRIEESCIVLISPN